MCLVCIEYSKQKLQPHEAMRNIGEMRSEVGEEHYNKAYNKFYDDYLEQSLDDYWSEYYEQTGFGD